MTFHLSPRTIALHLTDDPRSVESICSLIDRIEPKDRESALHAAERYIYVATREGAPFGNELILRAFTSAIDAIVDTRGKLNGSAFTRARFTNIALGARDFLSRDYPQPRNLLGDGILCAGDFAVIYGKPGSGKTWIGVGAALGLVHGSTYLGLPCAPEGCRVGLMELELHAKRMQERVRVMVGDSQENAALDRLRLIARPDLKGTVDIMDDEDLGSLSEWIEKDALDVVFIDALSRIHALDENVAKEFAPVLARIDQLRYATGCTIVLIHHEPKGKTSGKDAKEDIDALRGTSRLSSDPNVLIRVVKLPGGKMRALRFVKVNGAAEPDPIFFMLDDETGIPTVCDSPTAKGDQNREKAREALKQAGDRGLNIQELMTATGLKKSAAQAHSKALGATIVGSGPSARHYLFPKESPGRPESPDLYSDSGA